MILACLWEIIICIEAIVDFFTDFRSNVCGLCCKFRSWYAYLSYHYRTFQRKRQQVHRCSLTDLSLAKDIQQTGPLLIKLPLEIRQEIYSYCYRTTDVAVVPYQGDTRESRKKKRLLQVKCSVDGLLNLPLTCRQM